MPLKGGDAAMTIPGVTIHGFDYRFPASLSGIRYMLDSSKSATGLDIWPPREEGSERFDITTLEVQSGGRKSTLARLLHSFLLDEIGTQDFFTWNAPRLTDAHVGMIPQRISTVLHWRAKDLLPVNSAFAAQILPDYAEHKFSGRRLSELSGGQTARIFLASSFDRVAVSGAKVAYLILDEAFEGVDASKANTLLQSVSRLW